MSKPPPVPSLKATFVQEEKPEKIQEKPGKSKQQLQALLLENQRKIQEMQRKEQLVV